MLSCHSNKKEINRMRTSKYNNTRKHQVILLMITEDDKNWHYITVKSLKKLCRGVFSNNHGDYYCLNCLHAYRTKNALKKHEQLCLDNIFCHLKLPKKGENILSYKADKKSLRVPHIIYADLECLLRSINNCKTNSDNSFQMKDNVHISCGYAIELVRSYDEKLIAHYRGVDCMEKFVRAIKVITMMISETKKKDVKQLSRTEEYEFSRSDKWHICNKEFDEYGESPNNHKVKDHCYYTGEYRGAAHRKCSNKSNEEREIPVVFHNGSSNDFHFIIKEIAKQVDGLECIGENSEKYITFSALLNKQSANDKKVTCKLKFIDSFRSTPDSPQILVSNLTELNKCGVCSKECNNYKRCGDVLIYDCTKCNEETDRSIDVLIEKFPNVYIICNGDLDKFLLLLRKSVYPYEYMDRWSRFNE